VVVIVRPLTAARAFARIAKLNEDLASYWQPIVAMTVFN